MTPFPITRSTATFLIGLSVVTIRAGQPPPSVPAMSEASELAQVMVETPRINELRLSPTGSHLVFARSRASVTDNSYVTELVLQALEVATSSPDRTIRLEVRTGTASPARFSPQWTPDGTELTYFSLPSASTVAGGPRAAAGSGANAAETAPVGSGSPLLVRYAVDAKRASPIRLDDHQPAPSESGKGRTRPRIVGVGADYRWSPDGRMIAFTAPLAAREPLDPRRGVLVGPQWNQGDPQSPRNALFALDVSTGTISQLSPADYHVQRFDWRPDAGAVVVAATPDADGMPYSRTDLTIIELSTGTVRSLVSQPGMDGNPSWSPDGRWIAFSSHFGSPGANAGAPAVIAAAGGAVTRLAGADAYKLSAFSQVVWSRDSQRFFYVSGHRMSPRLVEARLASRRVVSLTPDDDVYDDRYSLSADGQWLAFTRESPSTPPELYLKSFPSGDVRALTEVVPRRPAISQLRVDRVSWPSRDGRFTVEGFLVRPGARGTADGASRAERPLPAVVFVEGGPSMVRAGFATDGYNGAISLLAAHGYAVLVPNTRGRAGYGDRFELGMRDGRSAGRLPYEDLAAGIDLLVRRGIADPDRLGILGHSYGGYLTAYAVTQTDRFKAAVVHEAHVVEWLTEALTSAPQTDWAVLVRDLYGITNVFDRVERSRLIAESPALNADRISTPTLLLFGTQSRARDAGRPLYNALYRVGVPAELVLYDEGHVFSRPAAIADGLQRTAAWFDYWVRGLPYPDGDRAREYVRWSETRRARRDSRQVAPR
jgi:dipeptidyl aminopeptidase/acylaminoacyl peptidase